ncbi:hypothetical protein GGX14DRAFT_606204 [Mycena pura]|uniref:Uncharacterized protein n=1 Tax=Mycena pura TaxID=153505 RepID=A0AAD6UR55_9AGAR|nr:hypothetical protein GGX14DRAFT_606204 [Mycena pura]
MPAKTIYVSSLPHPGPPPSCPLPPLPTTKAVAKRAQPARPVPVAHKPMSPAHRRAVPAKSALKKRPAPVPAPAPLPVGYAFVPPATGLTYPASYFLIAAGPQNAAPPAKKERAVFRTLTNLAGRVAERLPKRGASEAALALADESFTCCGGEKWRSLWDAVENFSCRMRVDGGGAWVAFRLALALHGDTHGGGIWFAFRPDLNLGSGGIIHSLFGHWGIKATALHDGPTARTQSFGSGGYSLGSGGFGFWGIILGFGGSWVLGDKMAFNHSTRIWALGESFIRYLGTGGLRLRLHMTVRRQGRSHSVPGDILWFPGVWVLGDNLGFRGFLGSGG